MSAHPAASESLPVVTDELQPFRAGRRSHLPVIANLALSLSIGAAGAAYVASNEAVQADTITVADSTSAETSAITNPAPEDTYVISTYNIKGSQFPDAWSLPTRMTGVAQIINGEDKAPRSDIVNMQEVMTGKNQYGMVKTKLAAKGYAVFPSAQVMRTNIIAYDKHRFKFLDGGTIAYPFYDDARRKNGSWEKTGRAVWVLLKDKKTGQEVATAGERKVAWNVDPGSDRGGSQKRLETARIMLNWAVQTEKAHPNAIVTSGHDDNATNYMRTKKGVNWSNDDPSVKVKDNGIKGRNQLPGCVQTSRPEILLNARDSVYGAYGTCPITSHSGNIHENMDDLQPDWPLSRRNEVTIDALYYSPRTAAAADWDQNLSGLGRRSSDHPLMWTKLVARIVKNGDSVKSVVLSEQSRIPD